MAPAQDPTPQPHRRAGPTVGVIGLGAIGDGVADSVHAAGLPLVVSDIRAEATDRHADHATVAVSPADVARAADVVVVAVVNDEQVHAVLSGPDGALVAGGPGTTFVVVSTITPAVRPRHRRRGRGGRHRGGRLRGERRARLPPPPAS